MTATQRRRKDRQKMKMLCSSRAKDVGKVIKYKGMVIKADRFMYGFKVYVIEHEGLIIGITDTVKEAKAFVNDYKKGIKSPHRLKPIREN